MLEIIPDNKINHASYQILDLNGKMIRANNLGAINNSYNGMIDLSALSSGQYIIQLNLDDQRLRQLIIKK